MLMSCYKVFRDHMPDNIKVLRMFHYFYARPGRRGHRPYRGAEHYVTFNSVQQC